MYSTKTIVNHNSSTKLRCLRMNEREQLATKLLGSSWQALAGIIRDPDDSGQFLYDNDKIRHFEALEKSGKNVVLVLLENWSTSGERQPDLNDLLMYLKEAKLLKAAHFVETVFLKREIPDEDDTSLELEKIKIDKTKDREAPEIDIDDLLKDVDFDELTVYPFEVLANATINFSEINGCKIGEGTYGMVFRAKVSDKIVAIKKLKNIIDKQFFTEVNILSRFKHENLLPLLGFSLSRSGCCLVYEYMENGSLQDRLACLENTPPLSSQTRIRIAYESALGINHLHTFKKDEPMVHRDIKSANILLDANFTPKVGDFGLVRIGDSMASSTVAVTQHVVGTSVYMAREAFNRDVSVKLDTFSFGVVLLELLTGLPPYDVNRDDKDLTTFMEDCEDIKTMLDNKVLWKIEPARKLHEIACKCLTFAKRNRPKISEVLPDLQRCCSDDTSSVPFE